ncbi:MAG TPA: ABC transporter permease [Candidatus Dormibacteraeota bacterium]|nr:ABC transporter permease [Candidatus Dormibacteraeota bacterium]
MTTTTPTLGGRPGATAAGTAADFETTKEVGFYGLVWRRFRQRRVALVAAIVLCVIAGACIFVPFLLPAECADFSQLVNGQALGPFTHGVSDGSACPSVPAGSYFHLLGTDTSGRDLLLRVLDGGRISLLIGVLTMSVTMVIATTLGALSGFFGGVVDTLVTAVTNAVLAVPSILLLVILVRTFDSSNDLQIGFTGLLGLPSSVPILGSPLSPTTSSIFIVVIAISLISWPQTARIIRSVILSTREKEFIEAARAVGTPRLRIISRHLIPNALGPIVVSASLTVSAAILTESAISFLGYGIQEPQPTWGKLLDEGRDALINSPDTGIWYAFWPGMLILLTVLSFNYIGDALRDAFDPRSIER